MRVKPILYFLPFLLVGCRSADTQQKCNIERPFPQVMVGVWEADKGNWVIRFEADGSVKKIRHMLAGESVIADGGMYYEGPDEGTYAMYVYGECGAKYDACANEVEVLITLDKFEMQLPTGLLEGTAKDYFTGQVSDDGNTWVAEWRSYSWLVGADEPDKEEINNHPEIVTFTKVDVSASGTVSK